MSCRLCIIRVFVPRTRDQLKYPAFDETKEDIEGFNVTQERQHELAEAIGDAPLFVLVNLLAQQLVGWQMYVHDFSLPFLLQTSQRTRSGDYELTTAIYYVASQVPREERLWPEALPQVH